MESKKAQTLTLFALAWPILIEILMLRLMGIADTFMLSHYSDNAVAAVGFSDQILAMTVMLCSMVTIGTTILVSRYVGAKDEQSASEITRVSISLNFLFGLFIGLILIIFASDLLRLMGLPSELMKDATIYMVIIGGFTFVQSLMLTASAVIKGHGLTKQVMYVMTGANILNIIGNYLFIFGPFGIPVLGVKGVAIATVASRFIGTIVLFVILKKQIGESIPLSKLFRFPKLHVKNLLKIGVPSSVDSIAWNLQMVVVTIFIAMIGTTALTTNVYTTNLRAFITMFSGALGQGTLILISRKIGQKKMDEAYGQSMHIFKIAAFVAFCVAGLFFIFSKPLLKIFTNSPDIIMLGSSIILLTLLLEPGRAFNLIFNNSLKAAGDVNFPVVVAILGMWLISVPTAYILGIHFGLGLIGVWIGFVVDEWVRGIILRRRWKSRVWEDKSKALEAAKS
ncbi:MATE family efflux transporter [Lederbergia panacisoli]|uniref:MATE family efflux transporter n=1 Tax=Lederbergia panacisoli TaxID=1255251 RepID=UPI00214B7ED3|nr:MATE family efflux transporter [Lederbergia panacisoli]MCR2821657.1 MATE family efflux transporter [Lederbergia panacisoli]